MNDIELTQAYLTPPANKTGKFASTISNIINPVFVGIFIISVLAFRAINDPLKTVKWLSLAISLTSVPTMGYVIYLVKTGYLVDIYMPDRKRRLKPMTMIFVWLIISILILIALDAPIPIVLLINAVLVQVMLLLIVTFIWKISFHSATITTAATVTLLMGSELTWLLLPMIPLVGWSRVHLHRHTLMQVIVGCVAGFGVAVVAFNVITRYITF